MGEFILIYLYRPALGVQVFFETQCTKQKFWFCSDVFFE